MYCNIYVCRVSIDVWLYVIGNSIDREINVIYGLIFLLRDFKLCLSMLLIIL
jgi:hypothetical protein